MRPGGVAVGRGVRAYAGRMSSMLAAAIDEPGLARMVNRITLGRIDNPHSRKCGWEGAGKTRPRGSSYVIGAEPTFQSLQVKKNGEPKLAVNTARSPKNTTSPTHSETRTRRDDH